MRGLTHLDTFHPVLASRLRLVFGGVILGLLSLDGLVRPGMTTTQLVSTTMAALAAIALLSQAFLEQRKEKAVQVGCGHSHSFTSEAESNNSLNFPPIRCALRPTPAVTYSIHPPDYVGSVDIGFCTNPRQPLHILPLSRRMLTSSISVYITQILLVKFFSASFCIPEYCR